jgi:hypothetical protein
MLAGNTVAKIQILESQIYILKSSFAIYPQLQQIDEVIFW